MATWHSRSPAREAPASRHTTSGMTSLGDRGASVTALKLYRCLRDRRELTIQMNATRMLSPRSAIGTRSSQSSTRWPATTPRASRTAPPASATTGSGSAR